MSKTDTRYSAVTSIEATTPSEGSLNTDSPTEVEAAVSPWPRPFSPHPAQIIALVYHNASWHYLHQVLQTVIDTALEAGYQTMPLPYDGQPLARQNMQRLLAQGCIAGFVVTPPADSIPLLEMLQKANTPFVCLTPRRRLQTNTYVTTTDRQGAFEMTRYLLSLGHRRIGFIRGPMNQKAAHERFNGYRMALAREGLGLSLELLAQGDDHYETGRARAATLLEQTPRPTAIFANNDEMAAGVLVAAHTLGLQIPAELSVAGFDNTPLSRQVWPALSTVRQPIGKMAKLATQILLQMLAGESLITTPHELSTELIIRDSTGRVPANDLYPSAGYYPFQRKGGCPRPI